MVLPINFHRTIRIKEPVITARIKSSSNLLIFLVCFFVCVLFHVDFTHLVPPLLVAVPARFWFHPRLSVHVQWVAKYIIYSWNLPSFFDFFLLWMNIWRIQQIIINFRNEGVSIYLALMIFNFIPANSAKWGEMLDMNIHKINKFPIWLPICFPLKKIVYASRKVFEICLRASKRWLLSFR